MEIQQKLSLRSEILSRKVQALQEALERKDVQLKEAIRATNMDPTALAGVSQQIEVVKQ
ncbi:hypothetical protein J437_LFUL003136 [Ladona fulva]|uniref:Dynein regulatory complex subunit 4 n=1 Tax=Ladona fulva TaxID=123851 RepID=A0A8K0KSI4_LADFU|nr:hypothetical protein J437_LFUL003136 [Ladona fulva]